MLMDYVFPMTAAFEQLLSKETSCPRFPLKKLHTTTNDLGEINVIGEGTAGENLI